jgi:hypothetical protein
MRFLFEGRLRLRLYFNCSNPLVKYAAVSRAKRAKSASQQLAVPEKMRLGGLGERRKLPQRGSGRSPDLKRILCKLACNFILKIESFMPIILHVSGIPFYGLSYQALQILTK